MPQAVFICYFCHEVFVLSPKHFCQTECDTRTAFHWDFCPRCKHRESVSWDSVFPTEGTDDLSASD